MVTHIGQPSAMILFLLKEKKVIDVTIILTQFIKYSLFFSTYYVFKIKNFKDENVTSCASIKDSLHITKITSIFLKFESIKCSNAYVLNIFNFLKTIIFNLSLSKI